MSVPAHYTTPCIPRRLAGRKAALRLVARGLLTRRSLSLEPASKAESALPQGAMRGWVSDSPGGPPPTSLPRTQHGTDGPADSGPGRAVSNPFLASGREAAHAVSVGPPLCSPHGSSSGRLPPAPDVVRDPAS